MADEAELSTAYECPYIPKEEEGGLEMALPLVACLVKKRS